jgi:N-acyl-D-amino-acid deacylase
MAEYQQEKEVYRKISFVLMLLVVTACDSAPDQAELLQIDVLIEDGLLFDGSGNPPVENDVGISGNAIVFVGNADDANIRAAEVVDADGLWVTPGFIDAHSHAPLDTDYGRDAIPYLHQGISTVVLGLDGSGTNEVESRLARWRSNGIGVNAIHFVGHGHVREQVLGREDREPTEDELQQMRELVRGAMTEGAFGLSTGLFYVPGTYASTEEVIELASVAAEFDGAIYDTHDRDLGAVYQGIGYEASVEEGIRIVEESGLRGIFSHYNLQGARNYGRAEVGAALINDARARGVDVWAAHHPYTATQSNLRSYTIPDWASAGGDEAMIARFDDPRQVAEIEAATNAMLEIRGGADKIFAAERELPAAEAVRSILRSGNKGVMNLELYDHENTRRLAQEAWMMTCTDGRSPRPDQPITHPRSYGAFPKKMRHFVFEEELLSPEFVIRSFSGLAADFYNLQNRGYLREGYVADIAVIDPDRYRDLATFEAPRQLSEGVVHAMVNGMFAVKNNESTGALAGVPLSRTDTDY